MTVARESGNRTSVTIVGAGVVGMVTAIALRQAGLSVSIVERRTTLPVDKACGEGIMPDAVEVLQRLGVTPAGLPFSGIRYLDRSSSADGSFPGAAGLGVRRTELSRALATRCRELEIEIHLGAQVSLAPSSQATGNFYLRSAPAQSPSLPSQPSLPSLPMEVLHPQVLVAADGLRSGLRSQAGLARAPRGRRFGIRQHFALEPWCDKVEVYWNSEAEAYVTPISEQEVGVAILFRAPLAQSSAVPAAAPFDRLLELFPALCLRLAGARSTSTARGIGPLHQPVRNVCRNNLFLVGDAAGYLDAITGEGMAIGFHDALALANSLSSADLSESGELNLGRIRRRYRRQVAAHRRLPVLMTRCVLVLSSLPWLRERVLRSLERSPALFDRLLAIHCRCAPPIRTGIPALLQLAGSLGRREARHVS